MYQGKFSKQNQKKSGPEVSQRNEPESVYDFSEEMQRRDQYDNGAAEYIPSKTGTSRKHRLVGGLVFYLCLIAAIALGFLFVQISIHKLDGKLSAYEKSQPDYLSQEVFHALFDAPDWESLYEIAGAPDPSIYEGKEAFSAYMNGKTDGKALTFQRVGPASETEAEYGVYSGEERVAGFTMVNESPDPAAPHWTQGRVTVYY